MDDKNKQNESVDLLVIIRELWKQAKHFWWLMLLVLILSVGAFWFRTVSGYTPRYQAQATYAASSGVDGLTDLSSSTTYYDTQMREEIVSTFSYIYATEGMQERIKGLLGMDIIPGVVQVEPVGDTFYYKMIATSSDPEIALKLLSATAQCYPEAASFVIGAAVVDEVEAPHASRNAINPIDYTATAEKGLFFGIVLCLLFLWIAAYRRRSIESVKDMKEVTKLKALGTVPEIHLKRRRKKNEKLMTLQNKRVNDKLEPSIGAVRTQILRRISQKENLATVVMITSTYAGEGKTTIASNLAISLARAGKRVILVDADLRNQSVIGRFSDTKNARGFLHLIQQDSTDIESCLIPVEGHTLRLLAGTERSDEPLLLLESSAAENIIMKLRSMADIVIVDAPPAGLLADAATIGKLVDDVVYVVRVNGASRHAVSDSMRELSKCGLHLIGYVLNGASGSGSADYGYGQYGAYGRYGRYGKYGKYGQKVKRKTF